MFSYRAVLILILAAASLYAAEPAKPEPKYDWGVAYYLSYDNDLAKAAPIVIQGIRDGVTSPKTVAAVQLDMPGPGGMRRISITANHAEATTIKSDDSADENQAIEYLDWFVKTYPCKHYAFMFLDHGGRLDEMCLDEEPDTPDKNWMSGRVLGEKLRAFKMTMPGQWDLLFFQQCGRGSLENLYSFRGTADFVLCSPVPVGAPNSYYTALHRWLPDHAGATGLEVAEKIAAEDKNFTVYTCVRGAKLAEMPAKLDAALKPMLDRKTAIAAPGLAETPPEIYNDSAEATRDARATLLALETAYGATSASAAFRTWMADELTAHVWFHNSVSEARRRELCGLSLFMPANVEEAARYRALDLYKDSLLGQFWAAAFPAQATAAQRP